MSGTRLVDGLNDAIRENPLAASLVGAGLFWMLFGNKVPVLASAVPDAARSISGALTGAGQKIVDVASDAASGVTRIAGESAQWAGEASRETVARAMPSSESVDAVKAAGADTLRAGAATGQRLVSDAQQRLSDSLERQPLLIGALGLAIGAGLASAFPATDMEKDTLGPHATAAREKIESLATETTDFVIDRGRDVIDEVKLEAAARGFTAEAAKQGFQDAASKVKNVAGAARDSASSRPS